MTEMKKHLAGVDPEKVAVMNEIRRRYESGELSFDAARAEMAARVGEVSAQEYALMEQTYVPLDDAQQCMTESLEEMTSLFGEGLKSRRPALPEGHPIDTYYKECAALRGVVARMVDLLDKEFVKNPWLEAMDDLVQIKVHYARKQNQLYSMLEQKGFLHPSKAMWTYDDHNRDAINHARALLNDDQIDRFYAYVPTMLRDIVDLLDKEEAILFPTSLSMISEDEFRQMRRGDDEIGYCLVSAPKGFYPEQEAASVSTAAPSLGEELQALLAKHGLAAPAAGEVLDVAQGKLTLEQINLIYRHMPVDLSYVDENELVQFYTDTEHRVFPRSAGVIGRQVKNCHPPKSVHVVEEIIEKFRSGEQSRAEFWINKPDLFIYIVYVAVRDKEGRFRGVLEMMQDCTRIRSLEGSQTLLNWANDEGVSYEKPAPAVQPAAPVAAPSSTATEAPAAPAPTMPHGCSCGRWKTAPADVAALRQSLRLDAAVEEEVTAQTKIFDLLARYPYLKEGLRSVNENFSALSSPLLSRMMKVAQPTVEKAAERVGMTADKLVEQIKLLIARAPK